MGTAMDQIDQNTRIYPSWGGAWDGLPIVNSYPAPTEEAIRKADEIGREIEKYNRREGIDTDNPGGEYQLSQIVAMLHRRRDALLRGGMMLVERIQNTATGEVPPLFDTRYGLRYRTAAGKWHANDMSERGMKRAGFRRCLVWVPDRGEDARGISQASGPFTLE